MVLVEIVGALVNAEEGAVATVALYNLGCLSIVLFVGNGLDHLEDQHLTGTMTELANLRSEDDGSGSESGSGDSGRRYGNSRKLAECVEYDGSGSGSESGSDDNRHELVEDDDVNAYCRPGANDWPACRSIGYPGCKPGMVRWPQCRNDL